MLKQASTTLAKMAFFRFSHIQSVNGSRAAVPAAAARMPARQGQREVDRPARPAPPRPCRAWGCAADGTPPAPAWPSRTRTARPTAPVSPGRTKVPNGSTWRTGLKLTRPSRRAVSSPSRSATQPCAASCNVIAVTTGTQPDREAFARVRRNRSCDGAGQQLGQAGLRPARGRSGSIRARPRAPPGRRRAEPVATPPAAAPPAARRGSRRSAQGRTAPGRSRQPVPPRRGRRARPLSAPMAEVVAQQQPLHAELAADRCAAITLARRRGRPDRDRAPGRRHARSSRTADRRKRSAGTKSRATQLGQGRVDDGQLQMAIDDRTAVARQVLDHRRHAAGQQPLGEGAGQGRPRGPGRPRRRGCRWPRSCRPPRRRAPAHKSTSIPTSRRSCAISRPSSRAASWPAAPSAAASRPISPAARQSRATAAAAVASPGHPPGR